MSEYHKIHSVFKRDPKGKLLKEYALEEFEYLKDTTWTFTEKIHGTNIRVLFDRENRKLRFGGKTDNAQMPTFLYEKLQEMFTIEDLEKVFFSKEGEDALEICLYGEGYGNRIQRGGGNYMPKGKEKECSFILFDIRIGPIWLKREYVEKVAKKLNIEVVPIIGEGTLQDAVEMAREGFNSQFGDFEAEGLVMRPKTDLRKRMGGRVISKIKCKDFK